MFFQDTGLQRRYTDLETEEVFLPVRPHRSTASKFKRALTKRPLVAVMAGCLVVAVLLNIFSDSDTHASSLLKSASVGDDTATSDAKLKRKLAKEKNKARVMFCLQAKCNKGIADVAMNYQDDASGTYMGCIGDAADNATYAQECMKTAQNATKDTKALKSLDLCAICNKCYPGEADDKACATVPSGWGYGGFGKGNTGGGDGASGGFDWHKYAGGASGSGASGFDWSKYAGGASGSGSSGGFDWQKYAGGGGTVATISANYKTPHQVAQMAMAMERSRITNLINGAPRPISLHRASKAAHKSSSPSDGNPPPPPSSDSGDSGAGFDWQKYASMGGGDGKDKSDDKSAGGFDWQKFAGGAVGAAGGAGTGAGGFDWQKYASMGGGGGKDKSDDKSAGGFNWQKYAGGAGGAGAGGFDWQKYAPGATSDKPAKKASLVYCDSTDNTQNCPDGTACSDKVLPCPEGPKKCICPFSIGK